MLEFFYIISSVLNVKHCSRRRGQVRKTTKRPFTSSSRSLFTFAVVVVVFVKNTSRVSLKCCVLHHNFENISHVKKIEGSQKKRANKNKRTFDVLFYKSKSEEEEVRENKLKSFSRISSFPHLDLSTLWQQKNRRTSKVFVTKVLG